jgi:lysophospholipase L1-like esterase
MLECKATLRGSYRPLAKLAVLLTLAAPLAACGGSSSPPSSPAAKGKLADGPVTVVALGDSLTASEGDDSGKGYVGRVVDAISAESGRAGSTLVNLGQSGWTSTEVVDGQSGTPAQLKQGLDEVRRAADGGGVVLATVLIGSNDLWYLYENGPAEGTPPTDENAAVDTYRKNLDRTVRELQDAGAFVVIGLPDDQSIRPAVAEIDRLHEYLPNVTSEEVQQMSRLAKRLDSTAEKVASDRGAITVDTNAPFWANPSKMADDGIHPNGSGYSDLAALWMRIIKPAL